MQYRNSNSGRQGIVLIVVLGVLTLLVILGTVFSIRATMERVTSRSYVDYIQAKLHAQSGIHYAVSTIRTMLDMENLYYLSYDGEDLNQSRGDTPDLSEENQDGDNILQLFDCPLRRAVRPSLMKDLNNDGELDSRDLILINNKWKVGISSRIPSRYNKDGDYFALKIQDLSPRLYVNTEDHPHFQTILENLTDEIFKEYGTVITNQSKRREIGTKIFQNKPYLTIDDLKEKLEKAGVELTTAQWVVLEQFITVHGWLDENVVKPVPLSERWGSPITTGARLSSWEPMRIRKPIEFPTDKDGKVVGRAPVNVNSAYKQLIVALITGLKGFYIDEPASQSYPNIAWEQRDYSRDWTGFGVMPDDSFSYNYSIHKFYALNIDPTRPRTFVVRETPSVTVAQARKITDRIIAGRPFRSWQQFHTFVDMDTAIRQVLPTQAQRDLLKANFNPNTNLNDFNPDYQRLLKVDKTDLTYYTTEFCLYPTGFYAIDSLGRVLDTKNRVLATAEIKTVVKLFDVYRETTQKQFLSDLKTRPLREIISENSDENGPTHNNLTLQTFPEIPDYSQSADYDGYITLATAQMRTPQLSAGNRLVFRASFDNNLNANLAPGGYTTIITSTTSGPLGGSLVPISSSDTTGYNWKPTSLYPDGVYSYKDSIPTYRITPMPADVDIQRSLIAMWVKPHFYPEDTGKIRCYLSWMNTSTASIYGGTGVPFGIYSIARVREIDDKTGEKLEARKNLSRCNSDGEGWNDNSFIGGGYGTTAATGFIGAGSPCLNHLKHPQGCGAPAEWKNNSFRAGKWLHLTWLRRLSTPPPSNGNDLFYINGCQWKDGDLEVGKFADTKNIIKGNYSNNSNYLRLGEMSSAPRLGSAPDSTIDEVMIVELDSVVVSAPTESDTEMCSNSNQDNRLDCFVAPLLAMTSRGPVIASPDVTS
ncbi:MAG: hypothetical protein QME51_05280, partial [Planctomycetota bacterium]|nr:hypothetical protein [Planctomycetota bacterium]